MSALVNHNVTVTELVRLYSVALIAGLFGVNKENSSFPMANSQTGLCANITFTMLESIYRTYEPMPKGGEPNWAFVKMIELEVSQCSF